MRPHHGKRRSGAVLGTIWTRSGAAADLGFSTTVHWCMRVWRWELAEQGLAATVDLSTLDRC